MVPGMATGVMRRGRQFSIRLAPLPITLPLQIGPMTRRAVSGIDRLAKRDLRSIANRTIARLTHGIRRQVRTTVCRQSPSFPA